MPARGDLVFLSLFPSTRRFLTFKLQPLKKTPAGMKHGTLCSDSVDVLTFNTQFPRTF